MERKQLTEDQVRDKAKQVLGLENTETALSGVGQITTFNQLGFKGISDKPDGWYLPNETAFPALILETKAENHRFTDKDRQELQKNCGICHKKYAHVVGVLYNGDDVEVYHDGMKVETGGFLLNKEAYFALFQQNSIDKKSIYQLTKKINDALHFEFGIKNLYHRMIFTSCTLVAKRFGAMLVHDMKWELFQTSIKTTLEASLLDDLEKNAKLQILIDTYSAIQVNTTPRQQSINDFIDTNLPGERKQVTFLRLDSTRFVKADDVAAMRKNKPGAAYSNVKLPGKLLFMTTRFTDGKGNERQQTFYLDEALTGIVCFKEN